MKKINWTEIIVVTPAALSLAGAVGVKSVLVTSIVLLVAAILSRWSAAIFAKRVTAKPALAKS